MATLNLQDGDTTNLTWGRGGDGASPGKVRVDSSEKLWWLLYLRAAAAVSFARSKTLEKAGVKAPRRVVPCRSLFLFHPGLQRHFSTHTISFSFAFTAGVYSTRLRRLDPPRLVTKIRGQTSGTN